MRITIFGANGPTGRLLTQQVLDAGHTAVAVTRRPFDFPISHPRLEVAGADAEDESAVYKVVEGADAVLSSLGTKYTRAPITLYSRSSVAIVDAMRRHGVRRLVVVSSSATVDLPQPRGGFLLNRVIAPVVTATIGKTTYADMRRMEKIVLESGLDWTVLRPSGLFDHPAVTDYELCEDHAPAPFTARADLAASMLRTITDQGLAGKAVAVSTTCIRPNLLALIGREALTGGQRT
ncbi:MAG: NAD(P)-dependent oxidoreductase [Actinomycetes bacterium]